MTTDIFRNDLAVEQHDTQRDLANARIEDKNLRDAIITALTKDMTVRYESLPGMYRFDASDLDELLNTVIALTARRAAEQIEGQRDDLDLIGGCAAPVRHAYTDAARIVRALGTTVTGTDLLAEVTP